MSDREHKALEALARYKFVMFGYHAAWWVKLNHMGGFKRPNPFRALVMQARILKEGAPSCSHTDTAGGRCLNCGHDLALDEIENEG